MNDPNPQQGLKTIQSQTRSISHQMTQETYDLLCNDPYIKYYFTVENNRTTAKTV